MKNKIESKKGFAVITGSSMFQNMVGEFHCQIIGRKVNNSSSFDALKLVIR